MELLNILESSLIRMLNLVLRFKVKNRVRGPPRDPKKCLKWYKFENQMTVSLFLQVGLKHMMHQRIRFNFLFNLEDDGKKN